MWAWDVVRTFTVHFDGESASESAALEEARQVIDRMDEGGLA